MVENLFITTIRLTGPDGDGHANLVDLIDVLEGFRQSLAEVQRCINDGKRLAFDVSIVDVSSGSVTVGLQVSPRNPRSRKAREILTGAIRVQQETLSRLEAGRPIDSRLDRRAIEKFNILSKPMKRSKAKISGSFGSLSPSYPANIAALLNAAYRSRGSMKGRIEKLNLHAKNTFSMFPIIGQEIVCAFQEIHYHDVIAALRRVAEVFGVCHFQTGSSFPYRIEVERIDVFSPSEESSSFLNAKGTLDLPQDSVNTVRRLRDDWE